MSDGLAGAHELAVDLLEEGTHDVLAVKHTAGLLVRLDVVLDFLLEVHVELLVLQDAQQALVDLGVQRTVVADQLKVLSLQGLLLRNSTVELVLGRTASVRKVPDSVVEGLQTGG